MASASLLCSFGFMLDSGGSCIFLIFVTRCAMVFTSRSMESLEWLRRPGTAHTLSLVTADASLESNRMPSMRVPPAGPASYVWSGSSPRASALHFMMSTSNPILTAVKC